MCRQRSLSGPMPTPFPLTRMRPQQERSRPPWVPSGDTTGLRCQSGANSQIVLFGRGLHRSNGHAKSLLGIRRVDPTHRWRGGRVAEGGGLLNGYTVNSRIVGSNPIPSAIPPFLTVSDCLNEPTGTRVSQGSLSSLVSRHIALSQPRWGNEVGNGIGLPPFRSRAVEAETNGAHWQALGG